MKANILTAFAAATLLVTPGANAIQYTFDNITTPTPPGDASGQIFVDVGAGIGSTVRFDFSFDTGGPSGTVTFIAFDDGTGSLPSLLTGSPSFFSSAGVSFVAGGGTSISPLSPSFVNDFTVKKSGAAANGIDPGESLGVQYALQAGKSVADVVAALDGGQFRIGLHIQRIAGSPDSQKAVNNGRTNVPDSASTLMLLGMALLATAGLRGKFVRC
ncbi:MAG: hypothetical protein HYY24_13010 [Verrucomicrobia bacterium]|nr:hypothetical protein [Verrucomicrobiota bacterium]